MTCVAVFQKTHVVSDCYDIVHLCTVPYGNESACMGVEEH